MLLKAFEIANETQTVQLNTLLVEKDLVLKVKSVRELFDELSIRQICKGIMNDHYNKAKLAINQISISEDSKRPLLELAAYLMEREV